jgi:flagella basal body P-ring formation protein FlgA
MTMLLFAAAAVAAGCLPVPSNRITARDIAAAEPAFAAVPQDLVLSYAPQPGVPRVFREAELNQVLQRHGVGGTAKHSICFEWPMRRLDSREVQQAIVQTLGGTDAEVTVVEVSRHLVPPGPVTFPITSLRAGLKPEDPAMWRGRVTYTAGRKIDVWARVRVAVPYTRVVAARSIKAGELMDASALRLETGAGLPQPPDLLTKMSEAAGCVARRAMAAGTMLRSGDLKGIAAVQRGDMVHVVVAVGPARVSFQGPAMTNAEIGQYVTVQNPINRKTLRARVTASGKAVIGTGL